MTKPLIQVENLKIVDTLTGKVLLHNSNFDICEGETLAIIGESGSGKSITCKALLGLNPPRLKTSGTVHFEGIDLLTLKENALRQYRGAQIAMIMQNGRRAFDPSTLIGDQLVKTIQTHTQLSRSECEAQIIQQFEYLSLHNAKRILKSYAFELSGGMLQRVMIALALVLKPKVIIADEPTTALDTITQYDVLQQFKMIKEDLNCTIIFISHDLSVVKQISDRIVVMKSGEIVEQNTAARIFDAPEQPYTQYLLQTRRKITEHFNKVMRGEWNA